MVMPAGGSSGILHRLAPSGSALRPADTASWLGVTVRSVRNPTLASVTAVRIRTESRGSPTPTTKPLGCSLNHTIIFIFNHTF